MAEAAAQGWVEERNLRAQEMVAGHTDQQQRGQSDENNYTSGILENTRAACEVKDKDQVKDHQFWS